MTFSCQTPCLLASVNFGCGASRSSNIAADRLTVPSAASEVLLHNGEPLYGPPLAPACFIPKMRQTAVVIDQAGNIWSINNWRLDFDIDTVGRNPGGDDIITRRPCCAADEPSPLVFGDRPRFITAKIASLT